MTTKRIDLNVWNANLYGNGERSGIVITAYPIVQPEGQYPYTNTEEILFTVETSLDPDDWEDEWFEVGTEPAEIHSLIAVALAALEE